MSTTLSVIWWQTLRTAGRRQFELDPTTGGTVVETYDAGVASRSMLESA